MDARLVIGKVLEEFAVIQAKYKLLENHSPLLGNDNSSKLVPGYDPGHNLGTGNQEPHRDLSEMGLPDQVKASAYVINPLADLSSLEKEQQEQSSALLKKYRCIFAEDDFGLGCAAGVTHHIDTGKNKPI
ncbi:hypothetical protein DSO57_1007501 [Entomophthora muscae]|uniref:Uncharacterized protein n=1 Tax=Entomophthora muscae TaxID=34485 RepID=A0ACC2UH65_9FUNG|nr:hypothetical protein DSO57_1007501 [Entomophthora muscae]